MLELLGIAIMLELQDVVLELLVLARTSSSLGNSKVGLSAQDKKATIANPKTVNMIFLLLMDVMVGVNIEKSIPFFS